MDNMIQNMVRFYSGYLQIQDSSFYDNRSINNTLTYSTTLDSMIRSEPVISEYTQRLESYALASSGEKSSGAVVIGILPEQENSISQIAKWVEQGNYLGEADPGAMLGIDLAGKLGLALNDTLILLGQGYHGVTAAGKYPVTGILNFPIQGMNSNIVYLTLGQCRELFSAPDRSTGVVIMLDNPERIDQVQSSLSEKLPGDLKIVPWQVLLNEIESLVEGKLASGKIIKAILFMVIGFGIWGTIIMLMAERKREFGIMIALGIRKVRLSYILFFETVMIGILGLMAGFAGSFPLVYYLFRNPIRVTGEVAKTYASMGFEPVIKFSIQPGIFYNPAITVLILFMVIFIYPLWHLKKLKTANALRA